MIQLYPQYTDWERKCSRPRIPKQKFKILLTEHVSRLPVCGSYWILKVYDSTQDLFNLNLDI